MTTTAIKNLAVMIGQRSLQAAATGYTETNMMIYNRSEERRVGREC